MLMNPLLVLQGLVFQEKAGRMFAGGTARSENGFAKVRNIRRHSPATVIIS